jgi:multicomponent Na+:H+ antiporter subunit B
LNTEKSEIGNGRGGDVIVETVSRLMVPFIQLFALYVIIHGAGGPGGGFQGGVIFGASFVLLVIAFGIVKAGNRFPEAVNTAFFSLGVYIYAGVGLLCIILGFLYFGVPDAQYLNYGFIPLTAHFEENRALGMDLVEVGIGITVMAVITSIFFNLVWKRESEEGGGEVQE